VIRDREISELCERECERVEDASPSDLSVSLTLSPCLYQCSRQLSCDDIILSREVLSNRQQIHNRLLIVKEKSERNRLQAISERLEHTLKRYKPNSEKI